MHRIKVYLGAFAGMVALALGGSAVASATQSSAQNHRAHHHARHGARGHHAHVSTSSQGNRETASTDGSRGAPGSDTGPNVQEEVQEGAQSGGTDSSEGASTEADGPGGHEDGAGGNANNEEQGQH